MQIINNIRLFKHSIKVAFGSYAAAKKMNLSLKQCHNVFLAGFLHDIGKIKLDQNILYKEEKLTADEQKYIREHVDLGVEILRKYKIPERIVIVVEQHHEHDDGTGYPKGLKKNEILMEARILRCVDVYDALTSNRAYRKRYTRKQTQEIMAREEIT